MAENSVVTVEDLIRFAVEIEKSAGALYEGYARSFSHCPEALALWEGLKADEKEHEEILKGVMESLGPERLGADADPVLSCGLREAASSAARMACREIGSLEDAFETAGRLEDSEVNFVARALLERYAAKEKPAHDLWVSMYGRHLERLIDFSRRMDRDSRRKVKPAPGSRGT
jgi:hypothetical protein